MKRSALVGALTCCFLAAQTPAAFEVASVKVNKNGNGVTGGCHGVDSKYAAAQLASAPPLGRCVITAARLSHMIGIAWELPMSDIRGGPDWLMRGFDRFDVQAEAEDPTKTKETQLRAMLQALLIERFHLTFHRETVERPGFALLVGEKGAHMKLATGPETFISFGDQIKPAPLEPVTLTTRKYTMAQLASTLAFAAQQPVVDKTGLAGEYDFTLHWDQDQGPTLQTAVREQLGLKLEPQRVPVNLLVVDSAQKPSAN